MRSKLISSFAGAAFALAASGAAFAADLNKKPVYKAPPPPTPAPVYSWTGFYIGIEGGGSWGPQ
jgi:outer membrane immunogenic protein